MREPRYLKWTIRYFFWPRGTMKKFPRLTDSWIKEVRNLYSTVNYYSVFWSCSKYVSSRISPLKHVFLTLSYLPSLNRVSYKARVFTLFLQHKDWMPRFLSLCFSNGYSLPSRTNEFLKCDHKTNSSKFKSIIPLVSISTAELYPWGGNSEWGELIPE